MQVLLKKEDPMESGTHRLVSNAGKVLITLVATRLSH